MYLYASLDESSSSFIYFFTSGETVIFQLSKYDIMSALYSSAKNVANISEINN